MAARIQNEVRSRTLALAGVLPKTFNLFTGTLLMELLKKISEIPATLDFDAFGRIYEYFRGEFAMSEGQGGGEFYTPSSIVQSARFVTEHHRNPAAELAICGVEKTDETGRLARLN
jgi:type I restriction enzyme M protein